MKNLIQAFFVTVLSLQQAFALTAAQEEEIYNNYYDGIASEEEEDDKLTLDSGAQKIMMDSLWDYVANPDHKSTLSTLAMKRWKNIGYTTLPTADFIRYYVLGILIGADKTDMAVIGKKLKTRLLTGTHTRRDIFVLLNQESILNISGLSAEVSTVLVKNHGLVVEYRQVKNSSLEAFTRAEISTLTKVASNIKNEKNKNLNSSTKIFVFCRENRSYPCLTVMKDGKGEWVKDDQGLAWNMPLLAMSKLNLAFHHENGNTPTGVYAVRGVMPFADRKLEYGQNRRLILDMLDEKTVREALPSELIAKNWWRQTLLAKEIGRGSLRIHGTQKVNEDIHSNFYPFVPSLGCLKLREGIYDGVEYNNQRNFLNLLMKTQGLSIRTDNEPRIRAMLYLVDINSEKRAVELVDLVRLGL